MLITFSSLTIYDLFCAVELHAKEQNRVIKSTWLAFILFYIAQISAWHFSLWQWKVVLDQLLLKPSSIFSLKYPQYDASMLVGQNSPAYFGTPPIPGQDVSSSLALQMSSSQKGMLGSTPDLLCWPCCCSHWVYIQGIEIYTNKLWLLPKYRNGFLHIKWIANAATHCATSFMLGF